MNTCTFYKTEYEFGIKYGFGTCTVFMVINQDCSLPNLKVFASELAEGNNTEWRWASVDSYGSAKLQDGVYTHTSTCFAEGDHGGSVTCPISPMIVKAWTTYADKVYFT